MNSKAFHWNILLRILFLFADMLVFTFALQQEQWYVTSAVTGMMMPLMTYGIIHSANRYRREVSNFLLTIQQKDYMHYQRPKYERGQKEGDLDYAFHTIARELKDVRIDKEAHYHHLREVVDHMDTAIISTRADGAIHLLNKAAREMLQIPVLDRIGELEGYHPQLCKEITQIGAGQRKLFSLPVKDRVLSLALRSSEFKLQNHRFKLVSLQDIRSELEAREVESWQKLIRMLRHEIMNSATPISSLSESVRDSLEELLQQKDDLSGAVRGELKDLHLSMDTIHTRTKGLLKFVQTYRKLTNLPQPRLEPVNLSELTRHVLQLLRNELDRQKITVDVRLPDRPPLVQADYDQVEQVVINVLLNAMDAVKAKENPRIEVALEKTTENQVCIRLTDNGTGIGPDELQHIFVPFYSTKEHGSGIGLSLARQIMKRHQGDIAVRSQKGVGTSCALYFRRDME
jgi:nitrogen fixation/metabolism regulation signal transduction histidine kinase